MFGVDINPHERRIASDGKYYTWEDFQSQHGNDIFSFMRWYGPPPPQQQQPKRSAADGKLYTFSEFTEYYGETAGLAIWNECCVENEL